MTSAATRVAALVSGEIDFVIDPAVQDVGAAANSSGVMVDDRSSTGTQYLGFDQARDALLYGDVRRQEPVQGPARAPGDRARDRHRRDQVRR